MKLASKPSMCATFFALTIACLGPLASGTWAGEADMKLLGLDMPDAVAGFQRGRVTDYEFNRPGLGYSVRYEKPGLVADVYVYDVGLWIISTRFDSKTFQNQFAGAAQNVKDLEAAGKREGRAVAVTEMGDLTISDSAREPRFLCRNFHIEEEPRARESLLCLASWDDKFVKFRVSFSEPQASEAARSFVANWSDILWPNKDPRQADVTRTKKYLGYVYMLRTAHEKCGFPMNEGQEKATVTLVSQMRQRAGLSSADDLLLQASISKRAETSEIFCNPKGRLAKDYAMILDVMLANVASKPAAPSPSESVASPDGKPYISCDEVASDPNDPDKPANVRGVDEVSDKTALTRCLAATTTPMRHRRHKYQMGRALEATKDYAGAVGSYRSAAMDGSVAAMVALGRAYEKGMGVAVDRAEARSWYERAAVAGYAIARERLATMGR